MQPGRGAHLSCPWAPWGWDRPSPGLAPGLGPSPPSGWSLAGTVPWARAAGSCSPHFLSFLEFQKEPGRALSGSAAPGRGRGGLISLRGVCPHQSREGSRFLNSGHVCDNRDLVSSRRGRQRAARSKPPSSRHGKRKQQNPMLCASGKSWFSHRHRTLQTWFQLSAARLVSKGAGDASGRDGFCWSPSVLLQVPWPRVKITLPIKISKIHVLNVMPRQDPFPQRCGSPPDQRAPPQAPRLLLDTHLQEVVEGDPLIHLVRLLGTEHMQSERLPPGDTLPPRDTGSGAPLITRRGGPLWTASSSLRPSPSTPVSPSPV